jgi:Hypothetical glycosyl hydrolase 6
MSMQSKPEFDYLASKRHVLVDMQTPDWDERLLRDVDPPTLARLCRTAGAEAMMLYCNSHTGLCNWPSRVGAVHKNLEGRDLVAELVSATHEGEMAACAYYSVIFNNWGYLEHPDWRLVPAMPEPLFTSPSSRYGLCCPNNPEFYEFEREQVVELASGYEFDAFFLDMVFWPTVCACAHCQQRWSKEGGEGADAGLPTVVDWYSPRWCRFQAARERWLTEHCAALVAEIKRHRDIPVFINGHHVLHGWVKGFSHELIDCNDLLGGDPIAPYNSAVAFGLLLADLTPTTLQYMHAFTGYIGGSARLTAAEEQKLRYALPTAALGGQYMAIDAVEPEGTLNPALYDGVLADVFASMKRHEGAATGSLIADVGVYWSLASQVDLAHNGKQLSDPAHTASPLALSPHAEAVTGVLEATRAQLPVKVVTKRSLDELDATPLIVLPNLLRMDEEEVDAVREYVGGGGRLLASGYTSLVGTDGTLHDDFLLADVFGCHFSGFDDAVVGYLRPHDSALAEAIAPLHYAPSFGDPFPVGGRAECAPAIRITAGPEAEILATSSRPYGAGRGNKDDQDWSSIHAAPPFADTAEPAIVRHRYGKGEAIYLTADLDSRLRQEGPSRKLLGALLRSLLPDRSSFEVEGDPGIWAVGHRLEDGPGIRLAFLNYPDALPARPSRPLQVRVKVPDGVSSVSAKELFTGDPVAVDLDADRGARFEIGGIDEMSVVELLFAGRD